LRCTLAHLPRCKRARETTWEGNQESNTYNKYFFINSEVFFI
jgi:hypothetical protein